MFLQIVKYGFVGVLSTFIHISIAFLYIYFIHKNVFIANILGFFLAFIFSYTVQSLFVFKHTLETKKLIKYFFVQFGALLLALYASHFLVVENLYIQTILVSILLPLVTFIIHKFWTFKNKKDANTYATK